MGRLNLVMAAKNYDRLNPLRDGRVGVEGVDLNFISLPVEETFYRQARYAEFDVSEMSLSTYVLTLNSSEPEFTALPVFPSRYFRHQSMFVNTRSGIESPADLAGRTIGLPEYQITATVWQRGILEDDFGVRPSEVSWRQGGVEQPGRIEKYPLDLPIDIDLQNIPAEDTLSRQLAAGEIDALFTAHVPSSYYESPDVDRLFPDYKAAELDYFRRTGIFPIMHVIVIRRSILEDHPWLASSLYKAFEQARATAYADLKYRSALMVMLPWLSDHVDETVEALGDDYWSYGVEENRHTLDTFLRYSHSQGLSKRRFAPEDLFAESTLSSFAI